MIDRPVQERGYTSVGKRHSCVLHCPYVQETHPQSHVPEIGVVFLSLHVSVLERIWILPTRGDGYLPAAG